MISSLLRPACFLAVLLLPAASACDSPLQVCTLRGCPASLRLMLDEVPVGDFSVEVRPYSLDGPVHTASCVAGDGYCGRYQGFPEVVADHVFVTINTASGSSTFELTHIVYKPVNVNGPGCGSCAVGTVDVVIPK